MSLFCPLFLAVVVLGPSIGVVLGIQANVLTAERNERQIRSSRRRSGSSRYVRLASR